MIHFAWIERHAPWPSIFLQANYKQCLFFKTQTSMGSCWHIHFILLTVPDLLWWYSRMLSCSVLSSLPNTSTWFSQALFLTVYFLTSIILLWTRSYLLGEFLYIYSKNQTSGNLHSIGIFLNMKQSSLFVYSLYCIFHDFFKGSTLLRKKHIRLLVITHLLA